MEEFRIHTDLACESEVTHDAAKDGTEYGEEDIDGFKVARLKVTGKLGEAATGKKAGTYITVFSDLICNESSEHLESLCDIIAKEIKNLALVLLGHEPSCVLVSGLGNREITSDSIGPWTVDRLTVTRHLKEHCRELFDSFCNASVCAIAPGVLGQTGIETSEIIGGVTKAARPDLIIAIDALAARSTERLGKTVQISDSGIFPGSGIGNKRSEISMASLGIPVIAVGVPTVVNSSTLVYDALQSAGYGEIDDKIKEVLSKGESFFVSPRQIDKISDSVSDLLAEAIDKIFLS